MGSSRARIRLAVLRYETRLLFLRLTSSRPRTLEGVNLGLAVIGAWSVVYAMFRWLPGHVLRVPTAVLVAILAASWLRLIWTRLARRPQEMFKVAAASELRIEELRRMLAEGMRNGAAYDSLLRLYLPIIQDIQETHADVRQEIPLDASGRQCLVLTCRQDSQDSEDSEASVDDVVVGAGAGRDDRWQRRTSTFAPERQMFIAASRRSLTHQNRFGDDAGPNVILDELRLAAKMEMTVGTATYGQIVRTSDSLINEFALFGYIASCRG